MKNTITLIIFFFSIITLAKNSDSLKITTLENKIELLDNQVKEIRRDELNYSIEKNLLKETYSNNYERISLVITIILGIIGLFGYLGLKDINTIKKEYSSELTNLSNLKSELETKINSITNTQIKYEKEVSEIIAQNEEQNKKIKLLELENKVKTLRTEKKYPAALENCITALQISPENIHFLLQKALIYTATRSYPEAIATYKKILDINPKSDDAIMNLAEVYMFTKQYTESEKLIAANPDLFEDINGIESQILFKALKLYHENKKDELIVEIQRQMKESGAFISWNLHEAKSYIEHYKDHECKNIFDCYLNYLDGVMSDEEMTKKLV